MNVIWQERHLVFILDSRCTLRTHGTTAVIVHNEASTLGLVSGSRLCAPWHDENLFMRGYNPVARPKGAQICIRIVCIEFSSIWMFAELITWSSGDSYTTTGFNYTLLPYPSASNPLGNPPYPGYNSANGPNWVGVLTTKYNASLLQTYNLAYGGATVDGDLVTPYKPEVLSLKQQVQDEFVPGYVKGKAPGAPKWQANDSIFAFWIGINDVGNSYWNGPNATAELNKKIFTVYGDLVETLHASGARNFVFVNVPPVDRKSVV